LGQLSNAENLISQGCDTLLFSPQSNANLTPAVGRSDRHHCQLFRADGRDCDESGVASDGGEGSAACGCHAAGADHQGQRGNICDNRHGGVITIADNAVAATRRAGLMGGRGAIAGTLIGAIIFRTLRNGLTLMNVQAFCQLLATGINIIVAMRIDKLTSGKQG